MTSSYHLVQTTGGATDPPNAQFENNLEQVKGSVEDAKEANNPKERPLKSLDSKIKSGWNGFSAFLTDSWMLEIASLGTSIALLVGLAILFRVWNGKFTAKWTARLSFTAIVAIMSKASQAAIMIPVGSSMSQLGWMHFRQPEAVIDFQRFDEATRSPLGNFRLLFAAPTWWAMLSLLIVIPGLGFEAALQQCLGTVAPTDIPILALIYDLDRFASGGGVVIDGLRGAAMTAMTTKDPLNDESVPPSAMIAGGNARTETVLPRTILYSCTTPSCLSAPYATLSFCSTCQDITYELSMQTSGFVKLSSGGGFNSSDQVLAIVSHPIRYDYSHAWKGTLTLANFSLIEYFPQVPGSNVAQVVQYAAQRCTINLCTNIYQLDVSQGSTGASGANETLLASVTQASEGNETLPNSVGIDWNLQVPDGTLLSFPDGKVKNWNSATSGYGTNTASYGIDNSSLVFISNYFASLFDGQSSQSSAGGISVADDASNYAQRPAGTGFWDSLAYILTTYGYTDNEQITRQVDGVISNIATSMGNWARDFYTTNAVAGNPEHEGVLENTYHIRWAWLILPAVIELLAILLLLSTIRKTREHKFPIWKTSTIATMFRGIMQPDDMGGPYCEKVSTMEAVAARKWVKLASTSKGYRLIDAEIETSHSD